MPTTRLATTGDLEAIVRLHAELHPDRPPADGVEETYARILRTDGLDFVLLEHEGEVVGTTYLNVVPNLTHGGRPYAWIENVVVAERLRGTGLGKALMEATLQRAWDAGCYKASLTTGRVDPGVHAFYRACGFEEGVKTAYVAYP